MPLPKVAYFSMEIAIDQSLRTYSGGLGFLSGSHMRSAGHLNLPMVGVGVLWAEGYGDQQVGADGNVEIVYVKRQYPFLKDTGIVVEVEIYGQPVKIKGLLLEPETFGTVPIYFLTTDLPENTPEHRSWTDKLYDGDERIRVAQEIILGIGGLRVLKAAKENCDLIHLNEGHALPAVFELLEDFNGDLERVRHSTVFTTHTPVAAGNETHNVHLLAEAGFFGKMPVQEAIRLGGEDFSLTVAALRMSRLANGVSQLHGLVANNMWHWVDNRCPIIAITNATNLQYWQDPRFLNVEDPDCLLDIKREMKVELFDYIKQTTGKQFDPDVLTVVWARRFTEYKRPALILQDLERIRKLFNEKKIQLIYAGKFHPKDTTGRQIFNEVLALSREIPEIAVLTGPGYELELSGLLKRGADVWLNTPVRPLEASGTSGMSANMNGAIHFSIYDGWAVEGTFDNINGYLIHEKNGDAMEYLNVEDRHQQDYEIMMRILENEIIPTYYNNKKQWANLMIHAIRTSQSYFDSDRMAIEYFVRLYKSIEI
ncbi:alpha-glucan family phosphorylase [Vampirovibrio chlorellavorus]|uniref:alpha-glucan family phosphorylase n=1 Tax=Vampirovibrio chlorellavorus TaxID=758823 RepID=UPI0026EFDA06|nr:alpha-glucan family phosphorylase [Vampirovibrio chlorellavorus]